MENDALTYQELLERLRIIELENTLLKSKLSLHPDQQDEAELIRILKQTESALIERNSRIEAQNEELKAINEEQVKLADILENSLNEIYVFDAETLHFNYVNQGALQNIGYSLEEMKTMTPFDIKPEFTEPTFREIIQPLLGNTEQKLVFETVHRRKNGSDYTVEVHLQLHDQGSKKVFFAVINDITERKLAHEELIKNEAIIQTAIENLPVIFYLIDHEGLFRMSVGAGLKSLGLLPNQVVGLSVFELYKDFPEITDAIRLALSGYPANFESHVNDAVHFNIVTPFTNSANKASIVGVALDITKLKQVEHEAIIAKEKAEESDRLKTAFLQNMSHEIRTPMNAIMGFSELMQKNIYNTEKLSYFAEIIHRRSSDLLEIINDILEIAKIESGQMPVSMEDCNLRNLFTELADFYQIHQARNNQNHINFVMQTACINEYSVITTDTVKLKQIFINLLSNAFKFTNSGVVEGGCRLDANNRIVFYVSDTGIGIPSDKHQYIFERFSQLNNQSSRIYGGTGLGLSIVKGLVNLLGGKIWLESEPGKGTTFYFTIDYQCIKPDIQSVENNQSRFDCYNFKDKLVLVVEDDEFNQLFLQEVLLETGITMQFAQSGNQAIHMALELNPDLILMDIGLPDMNGYDTSRRILQQIPTMKIIAQTAYASQEHKEKAFKYGCIGYISKPLKEVDLLDLVAEHLV